VTGRTTDVNKIMELVRREIVEYDYPALRASAVGLVGSPLPQPVIAKGLAEFSEALVVPYWLDVQMNDTQKQRESVPPVIEKCLIVADDRAFYLLAYVPSADEFTLVYRGTEGTFASIGVNGDPVGCFLAR
jgi:hypothetical protein